MLFTIARELQFNSIYDKLRSVNTLSFTISLMAWPRNSLRDSRRIGQAMEGFKRHHNFWRQTAPHPVVQNKRAADLG